MRRIIVKDLRKRNETALGVCPSLCDSPVPPIRCCDKHGGSWTRHLSRMQMGAFVTNPREYRGLIANQLVKHGNNAKAFDNSN
jgi:hypothetical protein